MVFKKIFSLIIAVLCTTSLFSVSKKPKDKITKIKFVRMTKLEKDVSFIIDMRYEDFYCEKEKNRVIGIINKANEIDRIKELMDKAKIASIHNDDIRAVLFLYHKSKKTDTICISMFGDYKLNAVYYESRELLNHIYNYGALTY